MADAEDLKSTRTPSGFFNAILSVGAETHSELPWTTINSNGWVARVSSGAIALSSVCDQANPVGALAAASLGASEIFRRFIKLVPGRAEPFDGLAFSSYADRQKLPHRRRDDRKILRRPHQDQPQRRRHQRHAAEAKEKKDKFRFAACMIRELLIGQPCGRGGMADAEDLNKT